MRVTLVHNPEAGDGEQPSGDILLALMRQAGYEVTYQSSKENNWDAILENPGDVVVVAGGDGTVGKVAKRLVGRQIPIAVLPFGTANNISKTLGLADVPLEQLIAGWATANRIKFDGAIASGAWGSMDFIEGLGAGLLVKTIAAATDNDTVEQLDNAEEKLTAVLQMVQQQLRLCPAKRLNVSLDGQDLSGEYILLEVLNIKSVGPNLYLAPDANPSDGLLDVVSLLEGEQEQLNEYITACLAGNPHSPHLKVQRGKHLQIQWEDFDIHIDDEILAGSPSESSRAPSVLDVKVNPQALEFLLPT